MQRRDALLKSGLDSSPVFEKPADDTAGQGKPNSNKADAVIGQGQEYIKTLNALNIAIVDVKLSEQIDELETVSGQIFDFISGNPENVNQIDKFMEYYFPQLIKLLTTYKDLALQKIKVEQMQITMEKIESVMDSFILAFRNQLNNLYQNKALDIKTDIDVLKMMLSQQGLDK